MYWTMTFLSWNHTMAVKYQRILIRKRENISKLSPPTTKAWTYCEAKRSRTATVGNWAKVQSNVSEFQITNPFHFCPESVSFHWQHHGWPKHNISKLNQWRIHTITTSNADEFIEPNWSEHSRKCYSCRTVKSSPSAIASITPSLRTSMDLVVLLDTQLTPTTTYTIHILIYL